jgi:hypothetical protein
MSKKPDLVVWDEVNGYNANLKSNPTNLGAPAFNLPNVSLARSESSKKMLDVFEREKQEIIERIERLYDEYNTSVMVWESKISFEPIVGKTYYLYNFKNVKTLSLISPEEWDKYDSFIGEFTLTSDRKWVKTNKN